ncbi:MAG: TRAP transporter substrate-binding protein DctP [Alphaproteobacteria bacterium]|nr:TRAP transporter substrate-binding protein DctP [Alphaproteobacteria bacterium]MCB9931776.1 TRAP transporter substrate-binding protein DctP [Alphaproteobacteria bacterium]
MSRKDPKDRIVHRVGGVNIHRRDLIKAGVTGASLAAVAGLPAQAQAQSPEFRFRMQSFLGPGTIEWEQLVPRFIKRVSEMSNGRIQIQAFPPGALVPTFEMLDAVGKGVVEIGYGAQVYWRGKIPFTLWTWGIPFAFKTLDHYDYLWNETELLDVVRGAFAKYNVHFLGGIYSDEWGATMSRNELTRLSDFEGVKIRSFGLGAEIWKANGASIVTIPGEEQYTAMSTGVIDASNWGSPYGFVAVKLHEVAKYYLGPSLINFDMEDMFMNMRAFNSLPADLQAVMNLATRVYAFERASTSTYASALAVKQMKDAGVKFNALPQEDLQAARKISAEALERMAGKDEDTQRVLKIIFDTRDTLASRPDNI